MARVYNILVDTSKAVSRSFYSPQDGAERDQDEEGVRVCRIVCAHSVIHNCELQRFLPGLRIILDNMSEDISLGKRTTYDGFDLEMDRKETEECY